MYLGIDVGGTKTLVASLDDNGVIQEQFRFPTPPDYDDFLGELAANVARLSTQDFRAGCIGVPGILDRQRGIVRRFGNLPWQDAAMQADTEGIAHCPMAIENDAKLAGLSEAMLLKDTHQKVLYVTVSTGIGIGLVVNQRIDSSFGDAGGHDMMFEFRGRLASWESFASGKAIVRRFGKKAADITSQSTWQHIAFDLAKGFHELIALTQPEIIVIGGSVGTHFDKYGDYLLTELRKHETPMSPVPPIIGAGRPELAVVYGCYDYAKQVYG